MNYDGWERKKVQAYMVSLEPGASSMVWYQYLLYMATNITYGNF